VEKYLVPSPSSPGGRIVSVGYIFDTDVWYSLTGMLLPRNSYDERTWRILSCALTKINMMRDPYPVIAYEGPKMEYYYYEFGVTGVAVLLSVPSDEVPNLIQKIGGLSRSTATCTSSAPASCTQRTGPSVRRRGERFVRVHLTAAGAVDERVLR